MTTLRITALALLGAGLTACGSGEPSDQNPEELITEVTITLTNDDDASDRVEIAFRDADGDGRDPVYSPASVTLRPGASYAGEIRLLDTINSVDITDEVEEEAEEHLFRYTLTPASAGSAAPTDTESDYTTRDDNGGDFAVGLAFRVDVAEGASSDGTLDVRLYHFDAGPKTSSTDTSDEIDVSASFPVVFGAPTAARR